MTMQALPHQLDFPDFFRRLREAREAALLLDYDGTLAPFQLNPDEATPYPGVREAIEDIIVQGRTRVVLVTGRWSKDLLPLLGLNQVPEIWGSYGWEQLRPNGDYHTARIDKGALHHLVEADDWTHLIESAGGRCELKPAGLAIHWRGLAPQQVAVIRDIVFERWRELRLSENLVWHDFDGGIELRAPGRTKAYAVETVLGEMGPDVVAAYLGDDQTDEDAFRAIHGRGLGVLVRPQPHPTAADCRIEPPAALLEFLREWHRARGAAM